MADESAVKTVPDPSTLTTEQLLREIATIKEWVIAKIDGRTDVVDEQFRSVETQFSLIERQRLEQKADTEKAVQAALSAAKEAVKEQTAASEKSITKSETATAEQLRQQSTTFTTAISAQDKQHNDLKERVGRIESLKQGSRESIASVYALAGFVASVLAILGVLAAAGVFQK